MAFQFFTSVQSSSPTAPGPAPVPSAIPGDGTEAALVLLNSSYPIPLPLASPLAARYQHCALSTKMPTKHKIYLRGQCGDGVTRGWTKHLYDSVSNSELRAQDYVSISQLTPAVSPLPHSSSRHCADPPSIIICPWLIGFIGIEFIMLCLFNIKFMRCLFCLWPFALRFALPHFANGEQQRGRRKRGQQLR